VDIEHAGGIVTRYCHMLIHPHVQEGQTVAVGQIIGVVGSSGHSSGPYLHLRCTWVAIIPRKAPRIRWCSWRTCAHRWVWSIL
jgi:hypothetical protein